MVFRVTALLVAAQQGHPREKDAVSAQKLGQLQSFQPYSHRNASANVHLLGPPNTLFATGVVRRLLDSGGDVNQAIPKT
jgi:hypothetical protein